MSWYYAEGNDRRGPVEQSEWERLLNSGIIRPETLVWREGMETWVPYSTIAGTAIPAQSAAPSMPALRPEFSTGNPGEVRCAECGRTFPSNEVVTIEGRAVCAGCKPLAMQRLKEGVALPGTLHYAGFWIRFGAKIIDAIIQQILAFGLGAALVVMIGSQGTDETAVSLLPSLVAFLVAIAYATYFNGKFGATPGKMACKLRIVRPDGESITYLRAFGRFFAEIISALILYIGYIMAAFDEEKRSLHDRICDTRVIRT
jgi:uncharacterized RDD family membrane protein YckC